MGKNEEEKQMIDYNEVEITPIQVFKKPKSDIPKNKFAYIFSDKNCCCFCRKKKKSKTLKLILDSKTIMV
jgi:thioredoxin-related protein